MVRKYYDKNSFDFAIVYVQEENDFFIIPVSEFIKYKGTITLMEVGGQQSKTGIKIKKYRNHWELLKGSSVSND